MRQYYRCQRPGGGKNPPRSTACLVSRGSPWSLSLEKVSGAICQTSFSRRPSPDDIGIHCHAQCRRLIALHLSMFGKQRYTLLLHLVNHRRFRLKTPPITPTSNRLIVDGSGTISQRKLSKANSDVTKGRWNTAVEMLASV